MELLMKFYSNSPARPDMKKIREILNNKPHFFQDILEICLRKTKTWILSNPDYKLTNKEFEYFVSLLTDYKKEKPLDYIRGKTEFYFNEFDLNKSVLIPRPETENLCFITLEEINKSSKSNLKILDIGTGSGVIAITLLKNSPKIKIQDAIDISNQALVLAKSNAAKILNANPRLKFYHCPISKFKPKYSYNIIISNPPYIPASKFKYTQKSVKNYEPKIALNGGIDGLKVIKQIISFSRLKLASEGLLIIEINSLKQFNLIKKYIKQLRIHFDLQLLKDQFGRYRYLKLRNTNKRKT